MPIVVGAGVWVDGGNGGMWREGGEMAVVCCGLWGLVSCRDVFRVADYEWLRVGIGPDIWTDKMIIFLRE
ncbi:MAG: hypothetical protein AAF125_20800 [Chloroflexota bacterium]